MCFFKENRKDRQKTATKDIRCYKFAYIQRKTWEVMSPYREELIDVSSKTIRAKRRDGKVISSLRAAIGTDSEEIEYGIHSFKVRAKAEAHAQSGPNRVVLECVIPKGAKYFKNKNEFVSTAIRVVDVSKPYYKKLNNKTREKLGIKTYKDDNRCKTRNSKRGSRGISKPST